MSSDAAAVRADLRKLACDAGVILEICRIQKQLSAGARIAAAREEILAAVHCYNPQNDESQLKLEIGGHALSKS